jgi:hypothetical protein
MTPGKKQKLFLIEDTKMSELIHQLRTMQNEIPTHTRPPLGPVLEIELKNFVPGELESQREEIFRMLSEMNLPWADSWILRLETPFEQAWKARQEAIKYVLRKPNALQKWWHRFKDQFEDSDPPPLH